MDQNDRGSAHDRTPRFGLVRPISVATSSGSCRWVRSWWWMSFTVSSIDIRVTPSNSPKRGRSFAVTHQRAFVRALVRRELRTGGRLSCPWKARSIVRTPVTGARARESLGGLGRLLCDIRLTKFSTRRIDKSRRTSGPRVDFEEISVSGYDQDENTGRKENAVDSFRRVLSANPSNVRASVLPGHR